MTVAEASGPNPVCPDSPGVELARTELTRIRADMVANESRTQPHLAEIHANYRDSSRNLLHYLARRRRDLRPLQRSLAAMGVSSLGRAESNVLASVDAVLRVLGTLVRGACQDTPRASDAFEFARGERLLAEHTDALRGSATNGRPVRIMVTMPSEAVDDYLLVHHLLQQGMDCMRINCAHDDAGAWARMIDHLKQAERALGRSCRVFMDLAGPKLRTGPLEPGPARRQAAAGDRRVAALARGLLEHGDDQIRVLRCPQRGQHPARPATGDRDVHLEVETHANASGTP